MTGQIHIGPISSPIGGRTDDHRIFVPANAYVLPADVVSAMPGAEGNTQAGFGIIERTFGLPGMASGGAVGGYEPVEIMAAGGEYVLDPAQVAAIGGGDMDHGHEVLDHLVKKIRAENIKTLKTLRGPAKR